MASNVETMVKVNSAVWGAVVIVGWVIPSIMLGAGWITQQQAAWSIGIVSVVAIIGWNAGRKAAYRG